MCRIDSGIRAFLVVERFEGSLLNTLGRRGYLNQCELTLKPSPEGCGCVRFSCFVESVRSEAIDFSIRSVCGARAGVGREAVFVRNQSSSRLIESSRAVQDYLCCAFRRGCYRNWSILPLSWRHWSFLISDSNLSLELARDDCNAADPKSHISAAEKFLHEVSAGANVLLCLLSSRLNFGRVNIAPRHYNVA